jgi:TM2 domain-containing membrane protein YozV
MHCPECGFANVEQYRFCPGCGAPVAIREPGSTAIQSTGPDPEAFIGSQSYVPSYQTERLPAQMYAGVPTVKDPNTAFVLELVLGFFGLLGIGYMYVGRTQDGLLRLLGWLVYNIAAWVIITLLSALIIGIVCIPAQIILQIIIPIWSASALKQSLMR